ncbi:hypothetical protein HPB47_004960 [Ixodes persulcatus]|uniref:Uncharacterized protein n=1 Tax=Ixodes persulcatus TaxID=34615 RepID=A0AC60PF73_IXOPE|nr:hypothetical protein HPB47_004960 [Ixodes persulcatus]
MGCAARQRVDAREQGQDGQQLEKLGLCDLRWMVTQLRDENRRLLDRLERTVRNAPTFDSNCKMGRHSRHQIQKQHPHLSSARWRHDPNLLHLREREALQPRLFNRKSTKPLPKCCRTQRGSPVSPHNSTASGRYRLTRTNTMRKSKAYIVWQWNCRGYGKKRGHFQQHINALPAEDRPDVIALQEPRRLAKLSGYVTFGCDNSEKTQVTTLVKRNVPVILHGTGISTIDHLLIEIIAPKKADTRSLFVLNIYSGPRSKHKFANLGIRYDSQTGPKCAVPTQVRTALLIQPIPKHMHPIHHEGRWSARVRALRSLLSKERDVYYVDAADYGTGKMVSAVIDAGGSLVASCSIDTTDPGTAEEVAIALALQTYKARFVVSDSQRAIRQFAKGRVSPQAARILRGFAPATSPIKLIWTPAHSSLPANEEAHSAARGLIGRAGLTLDPSTTSLAGRDGVNPSERNLPPTPPGGTTTTTTLTDGLVTFRDVLDYYAGDRARYPLAHAALDKASTVTWRRLQTNSYPNPSTLHKWYPDRYSPKCKLCGAKANLRHMLWECARLDRSKYPKTSAVTSQDDWDALLKASSQEVQEAVVRWAEDAAKIQGIEAAV